MFTDLDQHRLYAINEGRAPRCQRHITFLCESRVRIDQETQIYQYKTVNINNIK